MNRYLLRSLVAVSTLLLSIAVNAVIHPFESHRWERTSQNYVYRERRCRRMMSFPTPSLSIDTAATDPVKLVYSETRPLSNSSNQQVILLLDNQSGHAISTAVVKYSSQWPATGDENGSPRVSYYASSVTSSSQGLETVSIECGSNETLFLWISSVEFKDGSRWINPRHVNEQSF
jgi:hypothetical protein